MDSQEAVNTEGVAVDYRYKEIPSAVPGSRPLDTARIYPGWIFSIGSDFFEHAAYR